MERSLAIKVTTQSNKSSGLVLKMGKKYNKSHHQFL